VLIISSQLAVPLAEFRFTFSRSGGPGGQNVNKVNSKVTLHWNVAGSAGLPQAVRQRFLAAYPRRINTDGDVVVHSQRYRDQMRNREDCLEKLRGMILAVAVVPRTRRPTRPSPGSRERRLRAKQETSRKKQSRRRPSAFD